MGGTRRYTVTVRGTTVVLVITYDGQREAIQMCPDRAESLGVSLNQAADTARNNRDSG
ncbi:hypothetical protein [Halegenticoccus soli]|uniref:hypothetical protein n=1 Tax=Halegenticoccus soli TaxID=1985678 RepID=UPI0013045EB7|nr:hypothetical protein [Halegenticoccus soli]